MLLLSGDSRLKVSWNYFSSLQFIEGIRKNKKCPLFFSRFMSKEVPSFTIGTVFKSPPVVGTVFPKLDSHELGLRSLLLRPVGGDRVKRQTRPELCGTRWAMVPPAALLQGHLAVTCVLRQGYLAGLPCSDFCC